MHEDLSSGGHALTSCCMMVSMLSDEVLQRSYLKHSYHHYLACEDSMAVVRNTIGTGTMGMHT